ncbi:MAG: DNA-processing protein DprA [Candidatus Pacebacteria bacterium]|nr:DNA-processing protein DprA [Candidatus Paceibacterota bacterium]MCF7862851.1 DNA-processing protein DprA [Candidatus Paceibacterota bacterium]
MEPRKLSQEEFPSALLEIPNPPKNLWIIGNLPSKKENCVYLCVVGSRKSSIYGRDVCKKLINALASFPVIIVSGFALGIDTIAHQSAIEAGLRTIVFPGSGLSEKALYPKINNNLIKKVLDAGGCFLSEFSPDFQATPWSFPMRNRLMAGISKATLVIEAGEKSGTLITAKMALEYNKDLLAVPGSIFAPNSLGANYLIHQGAVPITTEKDLIEALGFEAKDTQIQKEKELQNLSSKEIQILEILNTPLSKENLIHLAEIPIIEANILLSVMEIKGLIKEEMGEIRKA